VNGPDTANLARLIRQSIDERGRVRDESHEKLPVLRKDAALLNRQRSQKFDMIAESLHNKGVLQQRQPVQRLGKLLLSVKTTHAGRAGGAIHERSQSGDTLYVEPTAIVEISNRIAQIDFRVKRIEEQVFRDLSLSVLRRQDDLLIVNEIIAKVDIALASAHWALNVKAFYPDLVMRNEGLSLHQARHPLLVRQLGFDKVVPLDLSLGSNYNLLVVTGPNTGGKTLILKTVGLSVWMANCGLPICASAGSKVPLVSEVFADLGDAQSLENSLSTFSGHLVRIKHILEHADHDALVLLDELGTGTDPEEGAAIGQAVLEELLELKCMSIANTHLGQLKLFSLDLESAENASMEFDPINLAPRYNLLVGVPGASHAIEVAEGLGVNKKLLERAQQLVSRGGGAERLLADVGKVRRQAEVMRKDASIEEIRIQQASRDLASSEADSKRRQRLRETEAEELFREHYAALMKIIAESTDDSLTAKVTALIEDVSLNKRWRDFTKQLRKGSRVYVPKLRESVIITRIDQRRQRVTFAHGAVQLDLPFYELTWADNIKQ
jgi:DNA mismatch repair protein MutS2